MATNQEQIDALSDAVVNGAENGVAVTVSTTSKSIQRMDPKDAFELQEKIEAKETRQTQGAARFRGVFG